MLDLLVTEPFALQLAAEAGGIHPQFPGQGHQSRRNGVFLLPQAPEHPRRQAFVIADAHDQPLRRGAQEVLQRRQVLHHGELQIAGIEGHLGAFGVELQQRPPQQRIGAVGRTRVAEAGAVQGDPPAGEPAEHAQHDVEVDFLRTAPDGLVGHRRVQADHRLAAADLQGRADILDEQPQVLQVLAQGLAQRRLLDQPPADQGEAAARQAMGIEAEELVVQLPDHGQPEPVDRRGGQAAIR
ncbi:hypothetical protein D3C84_698430 [compost metagenome]